MQSKNIGYLESLDHLRFFAAAVVVMFHTEVLMFDKNVAQTHPIPLLHQGHIAVPMFMVISGMILSMIAYGHKIDPLRFYLNRVLRIYPVLVVIVALGHFATPDPRPTTAGADFLMALLPISNLYRMQYGLWGGHLWSIAVELQFYILFPFLILFIERYGELFAWGTIAFLILLRSLVFLLVGTVHSLAFFSLFGNLDIFLIGVLAGRLYMRQQTATVSLWVPLAILVLNNLIIFAVFSIPSFFHFDYTRTFPNGVSPSPFWIMWPTLEGLMWAAFSLAYLRTAVNIRWLAQLGKYSYSMYIWHIMIAFLVLKYVSFMPYLVGLIVILPLTILLAAASFYLIEAPFLLMRVRYVTAKESP